MPHVGHLPRIYVVGFCIRFFYTLDIIFITVLIILLLTFITEVESKDYFYCSFDRTSCYIRLTAARQLNGMFQQTYYK